MSYFPTDEEEYELMHGDDLDVMNELDSEINQVAVEKTKDTTGLPNHSIRYTNEPENLLADASKLPHDYTTVVTAVNRRLFDTPLSVKNNAQGGIRQGIEMSSTPMSCLAEELPNTQNDDGLPNNNSNNNNRKRRLADLFGDIQDIDDDDDIAVLDNERCSGVYQLDDNLSYLSQSKKQKTDEELDLELIEKILEKRKRYQMEQHPVRNVGLDKLEALHQFKMRNLSYSLPKWPFITLVREDGDRVYVRMHSKEYEELQLKEINCTTNNKSMLGNATESIWSEAEKLRSDRQLKHAQLLSSDCIEVFESDLIDTNLWVEKYRPLRYLDLLSDETINRHLLYWLKMWDKVVFNKEFRKGNNVDSVRNTFNKRTGKFEFTSNWRRKKTIDLKLDVDEIGRPSQKIALLCGPPGLGKTTLAHTIARHAGYVVRELNASDDRSLEAFKTALENCTQMKSFLNKENKPNCIILDEIDGAPQPSIDFLIRFVSDNATEKIAGAKKGGKRTKKILLKRPIICICNDMYAPALRQLRQIAFIVNFPPIDSGRLADRLCFIAKVEGIKTDYTSMITLAEKSGNDIRTCLSVLQFYNSLKKPLTIIDVLKSNVGQKDQHRNLFNVWSNIFQIQRRPKAIISMNGLNENGREIVSMTENSIKDRVSEILKIINMAGDYEKLTNGIFENYLKQKMPNGFMYGVAEANEWFCFVDCLQQLINHQQNYTVYPYLQYGFVIWHLLFGSMVFPKITFPKQGFEYSKTEVTNKLIQNSFRKGFAATLRGIGDGSTILLDSIPLLKLILSPTIRSVSLQLLTKMERFDLQHTVEIMCDLGLSYVQTKNMDGTYQYQMEPDIEKLCKFNNYLSNSGFNSGGSSSSSSSSSNNVQPVSYWTRQLIGKEVEIEKIKRAMPKVNESVNNLVVNGKQQPQSSINKPIPNFKKTLQAKSIKSINTKQPTVYKDFFGRIVSKTNVETVHQGGSDTIVKSPIWYKYKEGFNNAVRRDVTIFDLL